MDSKENVLFSFPQGESEPYGHVPINRIYEAMDKWADIKLGEHLSSQNSVTYTEEVPKYILDEYAKQLAIDFAEFVGNYENGLGITPRIENGKIVWYFVSGESVNKGETSVVWELYLQSKQ